MDTSTPPKSGTSFLKTCFNGVNALSGVGILSIPYALSQGGWLSVLMFTTIAVICFYTGILLQRCIDSSSLVKTYPDIGELAFGRKGRIIVAIFMYLELYLVAIDFMILEGDNLEKLFPSVDFHVAGLKIGGKQGFVLIFSLLVLPTTWFRSLSALAYVSVGGIVASVILIAAVIWVGAFDGVGFHERGMLVNWAGIPTAMSLYSFCFSGHAVFPMIYTGMSNRKMFPTVLLLCFIICTLSYGLMGVVGYLMYGESLKSQVTLNLPSRNLSSSIAIYTTLINPFTKFALLVTPIAEAIEDTLHVGKNKAVSVSVRTSLVVSTTIVALLVPYFAYAVALTGSFLSGTATMLLPCICYLKIRSRTCRKVGFEQVVCVGIIVVGVGLVVVGTSSSLKQIIQSL
ncbi:vacuolar amino acid transporter 1-like [Hordeum vulgare]|uniref:Amino acid transporter transmembrane domain-containing protein n=2 Tax=Hordeum vulgare TaxID=4513 RepID=A0A287W3D6_HORVV|nr:amino acid transporter AVT1I-like [Hordeum vulgare subsp. vulgare]XP_044957623.1 amino acid transporter AVT1I-like [Hordeum vulgare subsp. vulgare]XP_044957624.1 amino acid transporter AVT1I-like [Hordeum vulgare subsp. vulgare]XP_044957625.1 amino acid transporter AVT1I-like [Hordeum vulgare subsp. vulgare]XP_044957626.1 amino acid transporter AVT1I-like [Hordeum vulgare subsp. vulgare]XP_044957627.1 amino acid transporter AVT1I-like [Hordeum vulgare subsp. vulgare]KAE8798976.1 vacuolar a